MWKLTEEREGVRKCGVVANIDANVKWRAGVCLMDKVI